MKRILPISLIVVAGAFFAFWYFQIKDDNTSNSQNTTQTQTPPVSDPTEGGKYLVIKEWGVRFRLTDVIKDMSYSIDPSNKTINLFSPRLNELVQSITECSGNKNISVVSRAMPGDVRFGSPWTKEQLSSIGKNINQYYYFTDKSDYCNPQNTVLPETGSLIIEGIVTSANNPESSL